MATWTVFVREKRSRNRLLGCGRVWSNWHVRGIHGHVGGSTQLRVGWLVWDGHSVFAGAGEPWDRAGEVPFRYQARRERKA